VGNTYLRTFDSMRDAVGIPYLGDNSTIPTGTALQRLAFSEPETQQPVKKCKEKDLTITSALHASLAATN
jgi:hypothetical protein